MSDGGEVYWDEVPGSAVRRRRPSLRGLGVAAAGFAAGCALGLLFPLALHALGRPGGSPAALAVSEAGLWAGFVAAVVVVSRRRGTGCLSADFDLAVRPIDAALGLAGSVAGRIMASLAIIPFAFLLYGRKPPDQEAFRRVAHGVPGWAVLAFVSCVGAPLVEELFFRGLVQTRLVDRWGPVTGITVTSLLFGAAHLIGWTGPFSLLYAWSVAVGGLALGTVRHLSGRLGTSMVAHALFNAQALAAFAVAGLIH